MPIFLLDENVNEPDYIIERCAEQGVEVLRVHQLGLNQTDDPIILEYALQNEYVLVTGNVKDFRGTTTELQSATSSFAGIILLQSRKYRSTEMIIRKIIEVAQTYDSSQIREWWL